MDARSRRRIETGKRVLAFSTAHPDPSPGHAAAVGRLQELLAAAEVLAARQLEGVNGVRAATAQKRELERAMRRAHLSHLERVAAVAAREAPELEQKLVLRPRSRSQLAFRTTARGMVAEAEGQKELLVKYGLVEDVLADLVRTLDRFDALVAQGSEARQAHVGARAELEAVADEVIQIVHVMDGHNRFRFMSDPELLAGWESASNVPAAPRRAAKPDDEVRPAAA